MKNLRSLGVKAGNIGESKKSDREILDGKGDYALLYGSLESLTGDEKFREMFSIEFYQKILLLLFVMRCTQLFIGKCIL